MSVGKLLALYTITTVVFFALDFAWLSTATSRIYAPRLGDLLAPKPNLPVAAVFYLVFIMGLIALAIVPGLKEGSLLGVVWRGALFGFMTYATYDLTNLATLRDWPWDLTIIDLVWGTTLNAVVSVAGYYAGRWLGIA